MAACGRNLLAVFGLLVIVYHSCFDAGVVVSNSMAPTLRGDGGPGSDWLLCEKISLRFRSPRRWEIVQYWLIVPFMGQRQLIAKRVAGLPGEHISIIDHRVTIDRMAAPVPDSIRRVKYYGVGHLQGEREADCGVGYFMLGDDSRDSADSRLDGPIDRAAIHARAWLIIWPPSRIGFVNP